MPLESQPAWQIQFEQASFFYPKQPYLFEKLDLTLQSGNFYCLKGANGTGKTSFLKLVLGELTLTAGSLKWLISSENGSYELAKRVALAQAKDCSQLMGISSINLLKSLLPLPVVYSAQHQNLPNYLPFTVKELFQNTIELLVRQQVTFYQWQKAKQLRQSLKEQVHNFLEEFKLTHLLNQRYGELSGGEMQLVNLLSGALIAAPVYIFDEAFNALDQARRVTVQSKLRNILPKNSLILLVEHQDSEKWQCDYYVQFPLKQAGLVPAKESPIASAKQAPTRVSENLKEANLANSLINNLTNNLGSEANQ